MKLPRSKKARRRMFGLIFLYSGIILSLGTSTMAWYSVQANVNIDVESASITIKTPFQYHFYAFNDNGFDVSDPEPNNWTPGTGYKYAGTAAQITRLTALTAGVPTNYTEINELVGGQTVDKDGNAEALTKVSGLWPGYSMSFAIKAEGLATGEGEDRPVLSIVKEFIDPGQSGNLTISGGSPTTELTLAQAMQISSWSGASLSTMTANAILAKTTLMSAWWDEDVVAGTGESGTESTISLGQATSGHSGSFWWFFTITFSNDPSTFFTVDGTTCTQSNSGNSSCYEGLTFELGTMTLKNPNS